LIFIDGIRLSIEFPIKFERFRDIFSHQQLNQNRFKFTRLTTPKEMLTFGTILQQTFLLPEFCLRFFQRTSSREIKGGVIEVLQEKTKAKDREGPSQCEESVANVPRISISHAPVKQFEMTG
jgi:hypothetical protein